MSREATRIQSRINRAQSGAVTMPPVPPTHTHEELELIYTGTGTPEGVVTAAVGSLFLRTDGGAGTCFYVKESGTGNTGWVAK